MDGRMEELERRRARLGMKKGRGGGTELDVGMLLRNAENTRQVMDSVPQGSVPWLLMREHIQRILDRVDTLVGRRKRFVDAAQGRYETR